MSVRGRDSRGETEDDPTIRDPTARPEPDRPCYQGTPVRVAWRHRTRPNRTRNRLLEYEAGRHKESFRWRIRERNRKRNRRCNQGGVRTRNNAANAVQRAVLCSLQKSACTKLQMTQAVQSSEKGSRLRLSEGAGT